MSTHRLLRIAFVVLIVLGCFASLSSANGPANCPWIYPFPKINKTTYDQYERFDMQQGWYADGLAWFIRTDASNVKTAFDTNANYTIYWQGLTFAPKLAHAADEVAPVYIILNHQQGLVFSAGPGDPSYSGVWRVIFVVFHSDVTPWTVKNTDPYDPGTNPTGLPPATDADFYSTDPEGRPLVVKYPMVALGQLGGPWMSSPGRYRIPQGKIDFNYTYTKKLWLPFWYVYCQDPATRYVSLRRVIVPDVYDPISVPDSEKLAPKIGANVAPGLAAILPDAEQRFFYMNDPKPVSQYPVIEECPNALYFPWRNSNFEYSPVMVYTALDRLIPNYSVLTNPRIVDLLIGNGKLVIARDDQIINAPVIPEPFDF